MKLFAVLSSLQLALCASLRAQDAIPVRRLTITAASDSGVLSEVLGVRAVPRGRVIVNDWDRRRLIMFDSTMKRFTVLTDTVPGAPGSYGWNAAYIVPYTRDSTLFIVQGTGAFVVIDPNGRMVKTIAPPRSRDHSALTSQPSGKAASGYDPIGRLVYSTPRSRTPAPAAAEPVRPYTRTFHDSVAVVRVDPFSRDADTLAWVTKSPRSLIYDAERDGCVLTDPVPWYDQWTMLPDGTIAVLRAEDYHIDWIRDGKTTSTPKMPFAWRRLSDDDKQWFVDSAHRAFDSVAAKIAKSKSVEIGGIVRQQRVCPFKAIALDEIPDYFPPNPPFGRQGMFSDREGNVWILPSTSYLAGEGLAYDVVNRKGEIFQRVLLPAGRYIVGFGADGIVYLQSRYALSVPRLERARIAK